MNICFTICTLSNSGGTERVSSIIANALSKKYNVYFVSYIKNGDVFFHLNKEVKVHYLLRNKWERKLRHFPCYVQKRYQRFLKKNKIDIVIDVDILMAEISARACSQTGTKLISWDHFNYTYMQGTERKQNALNLIRKHASQLVVLTKADKQMYLDNKEFKSDFITQIYNPLPFFKESSIEHKGHKVLALGRFAYQKGFDYLLKAWVIVEEKMSDWTLEIVGDDGKDEAGLHELKNQLGLKHVSLQLATKDVNTKYEEASIYALSSRFEGFPMVLLEATSMSLPIVAFDCKTGPNEIITDGENGFLVEPENVELFAEKLMALMSNDELRAEMGRKAYESSKRFTIDKIVGEWEKLIDELK